MPRASAIPPELAREGERVMRLCNACRYCEGFCAVFPALERRLGFPEADLEYLANLCHNCGECYYACQYAPPHEFALNFPQTLAELRAASYRKYAAPRALGGLFRRNGRAVAVAALGSIALFAVALLAGPGPGARAGGGFYAVFGHRALVAIFGGAGLAVVLALAVGAVRFLRGTGEPLSALLGRAVLGQALRDALGLRYLDGGGEGCSYPGEEVSYARRTFHHLTFYGFALCFASTTAAAGYHTLLGRPGPYPLLSLPVVLGVAGGVGLLVGPTGLLWLKAVRDRALVDPRQTGMDVAFLVLLLATAATGLLLLGLRDTRAMGPLLAVHLGLVLALFVTIPYGKFVHGVYRLAALARFALERRRPRPQLGAE